jgi:hypothetical protein
MTAKVRREFINQDRKVKEIFLEKKNKNRTSNFGSRSNNLWKCWIRTQIGLNGCRSATLTVHRVYSFHNSVSKVVQWASAVCKHKYLHRNTVSRCMWISRKKTRSHTCLMIHISSHLFSENLAICAYCAQATCREYPTSIPCTKNSCVSFPCLFTYNRAVCLATRTELHSFGLRRLSSLSR